MIKIKADHKFDKNTCRHSLMGFQSVLHCHHYMTLTTQMAEDSNDLLGGVSILISTMEDVMYNVLSGYFKKNKVNSLKDKIAVTEAYFSFCGLGQMQIKHYGDFSSEAELLHSHIDEGWVKKWKKRDKPVGYINRGFLQGALKAIDGKDWDSKEEQSIVCGAKSSIIKLWVR